MCNSSKRGDIFAPLRNKLCGKGQRPSMGFCEKMEGERGPTLVFGKEGGGGYLLLEKNVRKGGRVRPSSWGRRGKGGGGAVPFWQWGTFSRGGKRRRKGKTVSNRKH